jgi:hypothetical protein
VLLVVLAGAAAEGQTLYRWTDERGVVHFADVPPPRGYTVTAESLPGTAPARPQAAAKQVAGDQPVAGEPADADKKQPQRPPRVIITEHEEVDSGEAAQSFTGAVKNEGGSEARGVVIAIRVTEPTQGDECLVGEIEVTPSTLAPGDKGTYAADFNSPCFHGPTTAELNARWD